MTTYRFDITDTQGDNNKKRIIKTQEYEHHITIERLEEEINMHKQDRDRAIEGIQLLQDEITVIKAILNI